MPNQPPTLAEFFGVEKTKFALVLIDFQRYFVDPKLFGRGTAHTHSITKKTTTLMKTFHSLNLPIYGVHLDEHQQGFDKAAGGAHLLDTSTFTHKISKTGSSAIETSELPNLLTSNGHTHPIIIGGNSSDCYFHTVKDALLEQFQIAMLEDCVYEDRGHHGQIGWNLSALNNLGALRTSSQVALTHLTRT